MTIVGSFTVVGIRLASTDCIQLLGCIVLCDCADEESVCHGRVCVMSWASVNLCMGTFLTSSPFREA